MRYCNAVMIDIETLATPPDVASIIEIGMVFFDTENPGALMEKWYMPISLTSCLDYGLSVDRDIKNWWKTQERYYDGLFEEGMNIQYVLQKAFKLLSDRSSNLDEIWAKSPMFDIGMMFQVMDCIGTEEDVRLINEFQRNNFWKFRDVRTLVKEPDSMCRNILKWFPFEQTKHAWHVENNHDPVSDCIYQIESVYLKRGITTRTTSPSFINISPK